MSFPSNIFVLINVVSIISKHFKVNNINISIFSEFMKINENLSLKRVKNVNSLKTNFKDLCRVLNILKVNIFTAKKNYDCFC